MKELYGLLFMSLGFILCALLVAWTDTKKFCARMEEGDWLFSILYGMLAIWMLIFGMQMFRDVTAAAVITIAIERGYATYEQILGSEWGWLVNLSMVDQMLAM